MKRRLRLPVSSKSAGDGFFASIIHLIEWLLNAIFGLTHNAARFRAGLLWTGFFAFWLAFAMKAHIPEDNTKLATLWAQDVASGNPQIIMTASLIYFYTMFLNSVVLRHLLAVYVPFWLMQRVAAIYLADIFEKEEKVAQKFILQAAFAESYNTIHIRNGQVIEEDRESPMIQIGGPGYVVVEVDSAVLFERPDGSSDIIGPTTEEWYGSKLITGFERLRQGIDLRDVIHKQEINTRSRDGIPVSAKDIEYSYSIFRGRIPVKSPQTPYPFDKTAVHKLVYDSIRSVKLGEAAANKSDWLEPLPGKIFGPIIGEIGGFINQRGLSDFLVTVGKPEDESLQERKKELDERMQSLSTSQIAEPDDEKSTNLAIIPTDNSSPDQNTAPEVDARTILINLIYKNFEEKADKRGFQLNWIGPGTWGTPTEIIPNNHHEAWKLSRENFARGNPKELQRIFDDAKLQKQIQLIEYSILRKVYNDQKDADENSIVIRVLTEYLLILKQARDLFGKNIPEDLSQAIIEIERWLYSPFHSMGDNKD